MWKRCLLATALSVFTTLLHACSGGVDEDARRTDAAADPGKAAYERVCAECHESGTGGAPVTGNREAWQSRSALWEAVLFEHARDGYIDMPARGGDPDLSDREVAAAAEYMLSLTHPDEPLDQD